MWPTTRGPAGSSRNLAEDAERRSRRAADGILEVGGVDLDGWVMARTRGWFAYGAKAPNRSPNVVRRPRILPGRGHDIEQLRDGDPTLRLDGSQLTALPDSIASIHPSCRQLGDGSVR